MSSNQNPAQTIVDWVTEEYDRVSELDGLVRMKAHSNEQLRFNECSQTPSVERDRLASPDPQIAINNPINDLTTCEKDKFLQDLESKATKTINITTDFCTDILKKTMANVEYPQQVFLPNEPEYRNEFSQFPGHGNYLPDGNKTDIHWFNPAVHGDRGFIIDRTVSAIRKEQGDQPIVSDKLDVEPLQRDNSSNKILVHLHNTSGGKVAINMRTEIALSDYLDEDAIHAIHLPDPDTLDIDD